MVCTFFERNFGRNLPAFLCIVELTTMQGRLEPSNYS